MSCRWLEPILGCGPFAARTIPKCPCLVEYMCFAYESNHIRCPTATLKMPTAQLPSKPSRIISRKMLHFSNYMFHWMRLISSDHLATGDSAYQLFCSHTNLLTMWTARAPSLALDGLHTVVVYLGVYESASTQRLFHISTL